MEDEKKIISKEELLIELSNIQKWVDNYDWDYRMTRFEDKILYEKEVLSRVLKQIKLFD